MAKKIKLTELNRRYWVNLFRELVKSGRLDLNDDKCFFLISGFLTYHADYLIGTDFEKSVYNNDIRRMTVLNLLCSTPEIWHNGSREMMLTTANRTGYFMFDAFNQNNLLITDNYEQWELAVWDLFDTTVEFFGGDKENFELENDLYSILEKMGIETNIENDY